jgi:hypothetical protein
VGEHDVDYTIPAEIDFPRLFHKRGRWPLRARATALTLSAGRRVHSFILYMVACMDRTASTRFSRSWMQGPTAR